MDRFPQMVFLKLQTAPTGHKTTHQNREQWNSSEVKDKHILYATFVTTLLSLNMLSRQRQIDQLMDDSINRQADQPNIYVRRYPTLPKTLLQFSNLYKQKSGGHVCEWILRVWDNGKNIKMFFSTKLPLHFCAKLIEQIFMALYPDLSMCH